GANSPENNDFSPVDLTLARIVNDGDCWPLSRYRGGHRGAIAQLGERVVRKEGVAVPTPPASTSLRSLRELRLGKPTNDRSEASEGCRVVARRAKTGRSGSSRPRGSAPRAGARLI